MKQIYRYSRKLAAILDVNARKKERSRYSNFFKIFYLFDYFYFINYGQP